MNRKFLTLCIVHQDTKVLLGMKKRGFGEGRFNGFGGKVADGETIEEAAMREVQEEASITPSDMHKLGIIDFEFISEPESVLEVHIFKCTSYEGEAGESEEMAPQWFEVNSIPFEEMWKDDIFWFPYFLENKKFRGRFVFDEQHQILEQELNQVTELP